jgi:hypothetical protein
MHMVLQGRQGMGMARVGALVYLGQLLNRVNEMTPKGKNAKHPQLRIAVLFCVEWRMTDGRILTTIITAKSVKRIGRAIFLVE